VILLSPIIVCTVSYHLHRSLKLLFRLHHTNRYQTPLTRTKRVWSFVNFAPANFDCVCKFIISCVLAVLWYCWLGLPYNLYCVGGDVKHCSIQFSPCNFALLWFVVFQILHHNCHVLICHLCYKDFNIPYNQLPSSFRQPYCVHSPRGSPHPTHITSSQSSPSFSPSITPSTFHSRLKTHLFHKSFPL